MSRIIVKGLPKYVDAKRLRMHFGERGEVTDARVMMTKAGRSRQFGFVGFKTEEMARDAIRHFHRSFIDTMRIEVSEARPVGAIDARPWSRYTEGSSAHAKLQEKQTAKKEGEQRGSHVGVKRKRVDGGAADEEEMDERLHRFLNLSSGKRRKVWADDASIAQLPGSGEDSQRDHDGETSATMKKKKKKKHSKAEKEQLENEEAIADKQRSKGEKKRKPKKTKEKGGEKKSASAGTSAAQSRGGVLHDSDSESTGDEAYQDFTNLSHGFEEFTKGDDESSESSEGATKNVAFDSTVSDMDYLRSKVKGASSAERKVKADDAEDDESSESSGSEMELEDVEEFDGWESESDAEEDESSSSASEGEFENAETVEMGGLEEHGALYITNLSYACTEDELKELFSQFGVVSEVKIPTSSESRRGKGYGFITFERPSDAIVAMSELSGSIFQGRLLYITPSNQAPAPKEEAGGTYKDQKLQQLKSSREDATAWNSLFLRSDAVGTVVAKRMGVAKSELLDPSSSDLAARLALAETSLIQEIKEYLEESGVDLELLGSFTSKKIARSKTAILVKNLPAFTTEEELRRAFEPHGSIMRIILPPSQVLAMIEYTDSADARRAFRAMAYAPFKHAPLFLEWLPEKIFTKDPVAAPAKKKQVEQHHQPAAAVPPSGKEAVEETLELEDEDAERTDVSSVYVKNLNWETTEASLREVFAPIGKIRSVRIARKTDPKKKGKMLSLGFGFVEFEKKEHAVAAVKKLQGTLLDNHGLQLKLSRQQTKKPEKKKRKERKRPVKPTSSKILVKNLAFEATKKDLRTMFAPFGSIKVIRIPQKFDGSSRGFAFVEFRTLKEAKNAMENLEHTHLYGRHLVLEYAAKDKSVEELRKDAKKLLDAA